MRRLPLLVPLLLALAAPASAQSRDSTLVASSRAPLDSIKKQDVPILTAWCKLSSTTATRKAMCPRLVARLSRTDSLLAAFWPRAGTTPPPVPPVVQPKPDTTTPPVVVTPPPVVITPGAPPGTIFSHPLPPPANGAILAELPRVAVDTTAPPVLRIVRTTDLAAALDSARDGDEIRIPPGTRLVNVQHTATKHAGWITVRTDIPDAAIAGRQMTRALADSLHLATLVTTTNTPALWLHDGAHHVLFKAIAIEAAASGINALAYIGNNETSLNALPHHIGFDRVLMDGLTFDIKRCLRLDDATSFVINSSLLGCHGNQGDSQGILITNGVGPFLIAFNRIEGGHQAIMFGGDDAKIVGQLPRDAVIQQNALCRPVVWMGTWGTKTILELKVGQRVLVQGNEFCVVWVSGQTAVAVLLKSVNQAGSAPWSETSDITVRYNRITCANGAFNLAGKPESFPAVPASRISIYRNVVDLSMAPCRNAGADGLLIQGVPDVFFVDNYIVNPGNRAAIYWSGVSPRLVATGNTIGGYFGLKFDSGTQATLAPNSIIGPNTLIPAGGTWPAIPRDSVRDALLAGVRTVP